MITPKITLSSLPFPKEVGSHGIDAFFAPRDPEYLKLFTRERVIDESLKPAIFAIEQKMIEEFTDADKVAIALHAGCAIKTEIFEGENNTFKLKISTVNPVGFKSVDGKLMVAERK